MSQMDMDKNKKIVKHELFPFIALYLVYIAYKDGKSAPCRHNKFHNRDKFFLCLIQHLQCDLQTSPDILYLQAAVSDM